MNISFSGNVVLVAGGTGGLGRAASVAFLAEGSKVVVTYRIQDEFVALQKAAGPNAALLEGYSVDVTDEAAVGQLVAQVLSQTRPPGYDGEYRRWLCGRREAVGTRYRGLRSDVVAEFALWLRSVTRGCPVNDQTKAWSDCECRIKGCV